MKKTLFCMMAITVLSYTSLFAQSQLYRVLPGDTYESISRKFGTSVEALKEANPSAKTLYVGMKINIPAAVETAEPTEVIMENPPETENNDDSENGYTEQVEQAKSRNEVTVAYQSADNDRQTEVNARVGGGMFFNEGEMVENAVSVELYMAGRHYVYDPIFLETGLGYVIDSSWADETDYKYDSMTMSLQVPVLLGVSLGDSIGANIYLGPYVDFTISSKSEMTMFGETTTTRLRDVEDYRRFQLGLRFGGELKLDVMRFGVCYSIGLTSHIKGAEASGSKLMFYISF